MQALLQARAELEARTAPDSTALHQAAAYGHAEVLQALLLAKAERKARTASDSTALHQAARGGHAELVQALLLARTEVEAPEQPDGTALHWAAGSVTQRPCRRRSRRGPCSRPRVRPTA